MKALHFEAAVQEATYKMKYAVNAADERNNQNNAAAGGSTHQKK